ncbi:MAG: hypothetical protein ABI652_01250 [Acidobacteriota bacterium]
MTDGVGMLARTGSRALASLERTSAVRLRVLAAVGAPRMFRSVSDDARVEGL